MDFQLSEELQMLKDMVDKGELGLKTGRGFYKYE